MKKIPYGESNYAKVKTQNFYYVDKTSYIEYLESLSSQYLFFIRPRRFGKSLLASMLHYYYDINEKENFDNLFADTYIGKNPTPLKNTYPVLKLSLSGISTNQNVDRTIESFNYYIDDAIWIFIEKYKLHIGFQQAEIERIKKRKDASDKLRSLIELLRIKQSNFYLIIDEYDNFANNILMHYGQQEYKKVTHDVGFLRNFFSVIKEGTQEAKIDRLFITGVTPLVMADVTSGFNIGTNISLLDDFNQMVGFNQSEVDRMLDYFALQGVLKDADKNNCSQIIREYYDNYCFAPSTEKEKIYNSDMVLYFLNHYFMQKRLPTDLTDENIRTDYSKLAFLLSEGNQLNGNFEILSRVLAEGQTTGEIIKSFAVEELKTESHFRSLLYYLGLITISGGNTSQKVDFTVPNRVIATLMWDYIRKSTNQTYQLNINTGKLNRMFDDMAFHGRWKPVFEYIVKEKFYDAMSVRDFTMHEVGCKGFVLAYLNLSPVYIVDSESESKDGGYTDIFMHPNYTVEPGTKYAYLIEMKYLKKNEINTEEKRQENIKSSVEKAKKQLSAYVHKTEAANIKKIVLIISAREMLALEEL